MMLTLGKSSIGDIRVLDALIQEEPLFRGLQDSPVNDSCSRTLIVSRWSGRSPDAEPQRAEIVHNYFTIGISMESTQARLLVSDSLLYEGTIEAGTIHISAPEQPVVIESLGSYNWIRLHIGNDFLLKCQSMLGSSGRAAPLPATPNLTFRDSVIYDLVKVLVHLSEASATMSSFGAESIILAIVLRILASNERSNPDASTQRTKPLIAWRLRRVKEYIAARVAEPISLPDLAQAAGLTRMHFAAQFRAATGLRPREYVLQHRIAYAKKLLLESDLKLVEIALASGFQTQAHFTTVFKKFAYSTPHEWRCRERDRHTVPQPALRVDKVDFNGYQLKSKKVAFESMSSL